jgi:hypothetical protein
MIDDLNSRVETAASSQLNPASSYSLLRSLQHGGGSVMERGHTAAGSLRGGGQDMLQTP